MACMMFWSFIPIPITSQESPDSLRSFPKVAYFQVQVKNNKYYGGEETELRVEEGIAAS